MLLIGTICTVFIFIVQKQQNEKIEELIAGKTESAVLLAETILSNMSQRYQKRAIALTNPKAFQSRDLMIRAFADRDREQLLKASKPILAILQQDTPYFASLGWILPNNQVFLRVHAPEQFGKNVENMRPDIVAVNRKKKQQSGFNAGIYSLQYRIVQPVFYNDAYIGAVQFGIKASIIFDALQKKLDTIAGMAILNKECETVKNSKVPKLTCATHTIRARDVSMFEPLQGELDWNKKEQRVMLNGRPHVILNVLPVNSFQKEQLGVFFVALDISKEIAQKRNLLISIFFVSSFLFLLSFLILYFSYGSLVQKIINLNLSLEKNNLELEDRVHKRTASLRESTKRLQKILDNAPLGILIADSHSMEFQYANPTICTMLGYTKAELNTMSIESLHKSDDLAWIAEKFKKQAAGLEGTAIDIPFLHKDGTVLEADIISAPLELGEKPSVIGFIVDRTETKKLETQLLRAQKMEAIGLMAGGVAHDLNNILAGIVSYPELILLQLPQSSELRKPLQAIQESGKRAATVVADLLTIARGVASTREPHNINLLIGEYLNSPEYNTLKSLHPDVIHTSDLHAAEATVSCSPMHIKKTVMNLVTNALEAVKEKGKLTLATSNQQIEKGDIAEHDLEPGNYLLLTVEDDGQGIAAKDLAHIFEPFYTKKVMGQSGTGLGLAVVWNTVQDHNGKIFVDSSTKGTCFKIYLPVTEDDETDPGKNNKTENLVGNNEHLLVVDDEPQLRDIATQILQNLGYKVDSVCSGELAIQFIKDNPVDLIVLDMLMEPGMNGRQTYEAILKLQPGQKAIIASGFSESDDVKLTLQLGANDYIKKPYSMEKLGRAVKKSLAR